jgi:hypothetical protein
MADNPLRYLLQDEELKRATEQDTFSVPYATGSVPINLWDVLGAVGGGVLRGVATIPTLAKTGIDVVNAAVAGYGPETWAQIWRENQQGYTAPARAIEPEPELYEHYGALELARFVGEIVGTGGITGITRAAAAGALGIKAKSVGQLVGELATKAGPRVTAFLAKHPLALKATAATIEALPWVGLEEQPDATTLAGFVAVDLGLRSFPAAQLGAKLFRKAKPVKLWNPFEARWFNEQDLQVGLPKLLQQLDQPGKELLVSAITENALAQAYKQSFDKDTVFQFITGEPVRVHMVLGDAVEEVAIRGPEDIGLVSVYVASGAQITKITGDKEGVRFLQEMLTVQKPSHIQVLWEQARQLPKPDAPRSVVLIEVSKPGEAPDALALDANNFTKWLEGQGGKQKLRDGEARIVGFVFKPGDRGNQVFSKFAQDPPQSIYGKSYAGFQYVKFGEDAVLPLRFLPTEGEKAYIRVIVRNQGKPGFSVVLREVEPEQILRGDVKLAPNEIIEGALLPKNMMHDPRLQASVRELSLSSLAKQASPAKTADILDVGAVPLRSFEIREVEGRFGQKIVSFTTKDEKVVNKVLNDLYRELVERGNIFYRYGLDKRIEAGQLSPDQALFAALILKKLEDLRIPNVADYVKFAEALAPAGSFGSFTSSVTRNADGSLTHVLEVRISRTAKLDTALHEMAHLASSLLPEEKLNELKAKAQQFIEFAAGNRPAGFTKADEEAAEAYFALLGGLGFADSLKLVAKQGHTELIPAEAIGPFLAAAILDEVKNPDVRRAVNAMLRVFPEDTITFLKTRVKNGLYAASIGIYDLGRRVLKEVGIPVDAQLERLSALERQIVKLLRGYVELADISSYPERWSGAQKITDASFLTGMSQPAQELALDLETKIRASQPYKLSRQGQELHYLAYKRYVGSIMRLLDDTGLPAITNLERAYIAPLTSKGAIGVREAWQVYTPINKSIVIKVQDQDEARRIFDSARKALEGGQKLAAKVGNDSVELYFAADQKSPNTINLVANVDFPSEQLKLADEVLLSYTFDDSAGELLVRSESSGRLIGTLARYRLLKDGLDVTEAYMGRNTSLDGVAYSEYITYVQRAALGLLHVASSTGIPQSTVTSAVMYSVNAGDLTLKIIPKKPVDKHVQQLVQTVKALGIQETDLLSLRGNVIPDSMTLAKMLYASVSPDARPKGNQIFIAETTDDVQALTYGVLHGAAERVTGKAEKAKEYGRLVLIAKYSDRPEVEWVLGYPGTSPDRWFKVRTETLWEMPSPGAGDGIGRLPKKVSSLVSMGYDVYVVRANVQALEAFPEHAKWWSRLSGDTKLRAFNTQLDAAFSPRNIPVFDPKAVLVDPEAWDQLARVAYSRGLTLTVSRSTGKVMVYDLATNELKGEFEVGAELLQFLEGQPAIPSLVDPVTDSVVDAARAFWTHWTATPPALPTEAPVPSVSALSRLQGAIDSIGQLAVRAFFPMRAKLGLVVKRLEKYIGENGVIKENPYLLHNQLAEARERTLLMAQEEIEPVISAFEEATRDLSLKERQQVGRVLSAALQFHVGIDEKLLTAEELQMKREFFELLQQRGIQWRPEYDVVLQRAREYFQRSLEDIWQYLVERDEPILWDYAMKLYAELGPSVRGAIDENIVKNMTRRATMEYERKLARWDAVDMLSGIDHIVARYANDKMYILHLRPLVEKTKQTADEADMLANTLLRAGRRTDAISAMTLAASMRYINQAVEGLSGAPDSIAAAAISGAAAAIAGREVGVSKLASMATTWVYTSVLGWRLKSPLVNLFTQYLLLMPTLGKYYSKAVSMWAKFKAGDATLQQFKDPVAMSFLRDYDEARRAILTRLRASYPDASERALEKYAEYALALIRRTEEINRGVAYFGGIAVAEDVIRLAQKRKFTQAEWTHYLHNHTPAAVFDLPSVERLAAMLSNGRYREFQLKFGEEMVRNTQWSYGPLEIAGFMESKVGRVFGMFGTWSTNYLAFITKLSRAAYMGNPEARVALARLVVMHAAAAAAFSMLGIKRDDLFLLSPIVTYAGGPALTVVADAYDFVRLGGYERKIAYDRLARTLAGSILAPQAIREHARTVHLLARGDFANALRAQVGYPQELSGPENAWKKRRLRREFESAVGSLTNAIFKVW